jgi:hypothetical protein
VSVRVISSTMGQSSPASVTGDAGYYHFQRDPSWTPNDPRYRDEIRPAGAAAGRAVKAKERRFREFCAHRDAGRPVTEAGGFVGVSVATARSYERERLDALREAQS